MSASLLCFLTLALQHHAAAFALGWPQNGYGQLSIREKGRRTGPFTLLLALTSQDALTDRKPTRGGRHAPTRPRRLAKGVPPPSTRGIVTTGFTPPKPLCA